MRTKYPVKHSTPSFPIRQRGPSVSAQMLAVAALALSVTACATTSPSGNQMRTAKAGGEPSIIPVPARMDIMPGHFRVTAATSIEVAGANDELIAIGKFLGERIAMETELSIAVRKVLATSTAAIVLTTDNAETSLGEEGYDLTIARDGVVIRANGGHGLFYGAQTLRQLLASAESDGDGRLLPCMRIVDKPRYTWRGSLLDCGRHFMTKDYVKRYIDLLAYHKMNVLHWHLTEDQGWRIEIKKYPRLTEIGSWRGKGEDRYGGFYTQEDVKEIVEHAKKRYVTVVPEIEMPGHSLGALAAYPKLACTSGPFEVGVRWGVYDDVYCGGNDKVFAFLEDVLREVMELFPSEYIHIGGDECPKKRWKACAKCQARIKSEGLKDEHELQAYFIKRMEKFLNDNGRRLVGWDEILEGGLAPNATVQSWRGMKGAIAAATTGHDVVSSPTSHCYLDYPQMRDPSMPGWMGVITLDRIYSFEPTPEELTPEQAKHVLGAEGNIWTERAPQELVDRRVYPRLCALSEVTWSPKEHRNWQDFTRRMRPHYGRLDAMDVTYFIPPPTFGSADSVFTDLLDVSMEDTSGLATIRYTTDGSDPTASSPVLGEAVTLTDTTTISARSFWPNGRASDVVRLTYKKQTPREPVRVTGKSPGVAYEYYEGQWSKLPDFSTLTPTSSGNADGFTLAIPRNEDRFGIIFTGYIDVPRDGLYSFYTNSDDGSSLLIGSDIVVDNDGMHGMNQRRGQIALKAGVHPITVTYFDAGGGDGLIVEYEGPGLEKQAIPAAALKHE